MELLDILACPMCHGDVQQRDAHTLLCASCRKGFDVQNGVPFMLPGCGTTSFVHERDLDVREGYVPQVQPIMDSLNPDQVVLDIGAGNRSIDSRNIIRMDAVWSPFVDIIGDAHRLPFKTDAIDLVYSCSVFEHLMQPFAAASEILRVLKPGGTAIADCAFVYPFHGYPCMYFNASAQGMRQLFADFTIVDVMVAPWQGPSYALEALVAEYVKRFKPQTDVEEQWVNALKALDRFPVHDFDHRFDQEDAARIASGTTLVGLKPTSGRGSWVPTILESIWRQDAELSLKFPIPSAFLAFIVSDVPHSLLIWAKAEGRKRHPELAAWIDSRPTFDKRLL